MEVLAGGHVVRALTIAGSDSGGGAGIQADLKTFAAFAVYGASVVTALTAQNTVGVQGVAYTDAAMVRQQLESVLSDIGADAVKTGMLGSAEIIEVVSGTLQEFGVQKLVVDPVMIAKGGEPLIDDAAVATLRDRLLPLAEVVTPNIPEAEVLTGRPIRSWRDCLESARILREFGPRTVIIKGGHAQAAWSDEAPWATDQAPEAVDVLYDGSGYTYFATPRVDSRKTHGTGCTYSAAITAGLAAGRSRTDTVAAAKQFVYEAIRSAAGWDVGAGHGPTDHSVKPQVSQGLQAGQAYRLIGDRWERIGEERLR